MTSLWLNIIRENRKKRYGVTLPFIIGATRIPIGNVLDSETENITEVRNLFVSIQEELRGEVLTLSLCARLKQPVFALGYSNFKLSNYYSKFSSSADGLGGFYVHQNILSGGIGNLDELVGKLWMLNGSAILNGEFSYNGGIFDKYTDGDISFIEAVKNNSDEEM